MINKKSVYKDTQALIKACKRHNRKAEEILYQKFFADAYRTCNRYLKQKADVLAVVNEGFLKVFQNLDQYNNKKGTLGAWIHRIMVNNAIDAVRKRNRELVNVKYVEEEETMGDYALNQGLLKLEADEVLSFVKKLPVMCRSVFNLIIVDGFNHQEVAKKLDISEGSSRWHLSEARKRLRDLIIQREKILDD